MTLLLVVRLLIDSLSSVIKGDWATSEGSRDLENSADRHLCSPIPTSTFSKVKHSFKSSSILGRTCWVKARVVQDAHFASGGGKSPFGLMDRHKLIKFTFWYRNPKAARGGGLLKWDAVRWGKDCEATPRIQFQSEHRQLRLNVKINSSYNKIKPH